MSDLTTLVPSLQRALAVPGTFDVLFPDTLDADLSSTLLDGFAEIQLDGLLLDNVADDAGLVTPDLTRAQAALVVLYASVRVLVTEIRNRKTHVRYEGGGAVFEEDQSATMLVELLRQAQARKADLVVQARRGALTDAFLMVDLYCAKAW